MNQIAPPPVTPLKAGLVSLGVFLGGGGAGWLLAFLFAPGAGLAIAISGLMLPAAFVIGTLAWTGVALLTLPFALWRRLRPPAAPESGHAATESGRDRTGGRRMEDAGISPALPPGARLFVPVSVLIGTLAGAAVGLIGAAPFFVTWFCYTVIGYAYGRLLHALALRGYLSIIQD